MSHIPRIPIPDPPEAVVFGRRAALGALVCTVVVVGCTWALGTRIWQMIQPATISWDAIPMAVEVPPDRVHAVSRGKADPSTLLDSVENELASNNRNGSRIAEERRLLMEMFPHSASRNNSFLQEERPTQSVRPSAPNPTMKIAEPIPQLEISVPDAEKTSSPDSVSLAPKSNSFVDLKPWRATEPKAEGNPGLASDTTTGDELKFPPRFPVHGTVLPTAALHAPKFVQVGDNTQSVSGEPTEQVAKTSPLTVLINTLSDTATRLERPQPMVPDVNFREIGAASRELPDVSEERYVTVEQGDSFWTIAQRVYGDGNYFTAVWFENRDLANNQDDLVAGQRLRCPSPEVLKEKYPNHVPKTASTLTAGNGGGSPGRVYCTMAGDTLFGVARQQLGQASRYLEIAELNRTVLGQSIGHLDPLPEGLKIVLPKPAP